VKTPEFPDGKEDMQCAPQDSLAAIKSRFGDNTKSMLSPLESMARKIEVSGSRAPDFGGPADAR
jgi:hypothetical protein